MTEAVSAPPPQLMPPRARRTRLSALEALERGFALFRSTFAREAWRYYIGALPLVLCFIPVWVLNGQIQVSNGALFLQASLLAVAYLLRVWMIGSYMQQVRRAAFGTPILKPAGAAAKLAAWGRLLAWKITLSAGALATLPSIAGPAWLYSASEFASLEAQEDAAEQHSFGGCISLASQWFGGGVLFFLMLIPLWVAVWLNALILATVVPQLLHSVFGVNTLLSTTMGIYSLIESSAFWLSLSAGAWLALDPVIKCTFVVVYQHLRSRREGDDLRSLLASLPREHQKKAELIAPAANQRKVLTGALLLLATILSIFSLTRTARAEQSSSPSNPTQAAADPAHDQRVQSLRHALDQESQRAIYRWHDSEHPDTPTWFDKLMSKIGDSIEHAWNSLWDFLHKLWPSGMNLTPGGSGPSFEMKDLRGWLALIAILTLAAAGVLVWLRRRRQAASLSIPLTVASLPDLSETAIASERSEDEWFALANRLQGEGELRFAFRAAYFALLAGLAQREWLTIRRDRTNREYLGEFTRRWRRRPQAATEARAEVPEKLRGSLRQFDRVWYGLHVVTPESVTTYRDTQREFLNHV